ncbi:hypothetical protein ROJ8625_02134 [Roseivivax jejudonensis]|uniref:Uncharacterized protein n=1 Tax=Roseivivax jejudonensis TaxID=1529041 RepID=A0A1X6Z9W9_9RHOB|nr:hypothetical protein [Roseivivax jejudonensis]SLN43172.1 hypothetical protein ROJ8625_02134 [Roseivivax jejudonensis]
MAGRGAPLVFLERRTYRQRRLRDAARLLPVLGLFAWTVPLLWPRGDAAPGTAAALTYLFAVWAALVIAGASLSVLLSRGVDDDEPGERPAPGFGAAPFVPEPATDPKPSVGSDGAARTPGAGAGGEGRP